MKVLIDKNTRWARPPEESIQNTTLLDAIIGKGPEKELLLCCARACVGVDQTGRIKRLLRQNIDWDYLIKIAREEAVLPLLYSCLHLTCPEEIPHNVLNRLRSEFHANALHNLRLTEELLKILRLFTENGIVAVPFKGPALAISVYGDLAFRQFSDLDIIVRKSDVLGAKSLLMSAGYQPSSDQGRGTVGLDLRAYNALSFVGDDRRSPVDLHWRILPQYTFFPYRTEPLWEQLECLSIAQETVLNLKRETLLLALCVHGGKHNWIRLGWICDVAKLIHTSPEMDWEVIVKQARKQGSWRMLLLGLFLANKMAKLSLPQSLAQRVSDREAVALATQMNGQMFSTSDYSDGHLERVLTDLTKRERIWDRVSYCLGVQYLTPSPKDYAVLSLHTHLSFLYYLVRPIRLLREYGWASLKLLLKHIFRG